MVQHSYDRHHSVQGKLGPIMACYFCHVIRVISVDFITWVMFIFKFRTDKGRADRSCSATFTEILGYY